MEKIKVYSKFKYFLFCYFIVGFLVSCGYKADPSPLFPTSRTAIDAEIQRRKVESNESPAPSTKSDKTKMPL